MHIIARSLSTLPHILTVRPPINKTPLIIGSLEGVLELDLAKQTPVLGRFSVQPDQFVIRERFSHKVVLSPGTYFLIPGLDKILAIYPSRLLYLETPPCKSLTRDGISLLVTSRLEVQMQDPLVALKMHTPFSLSLAKADSMARETFSCYPLQEIVEEQTRIQQEILHKIQEKVKNYGLQFLSYAMVDITLPEEWQRAFQEKSLSQQNLAIARSNMVLEKEQADNQAACIRAIGEAMRENPQAMSAYFVKEAFTLAKEHSDLVKNRTPPSDG